MKRGKAVGFLSRALSGTQCDRQWAQIHSTAERLGLDLCLVVFDGDLMRLMTLVWGEDACTVITPNSAHFADFDLEALLKIAKPIYSDVSGRTSR